MLPRLVNDYNKPLRITLADTVHNWNTGEEMDDVYRHYLQNRSSQQLQQVYQQLLHLMFLFTKENFSTTKREADFELALADFSKVKPTSSHDLLLLFGLMVNPVQRFPEFILFLRDLLKHRPSDHYD